MPISELSHQHESLRDLTYDLLDGVNEGDWEKILRAAHMYLRLAREHMPHEERDVFEPARTHLGLAELGALRTRFDDLEREAFAERDRAYYLDLLRRLCQQAGLPEPGRG